jgi:hypothetical protein
MDEVRHKMEEIADEQKDVVLDAIANEHWLRNRAGGLTAANREARRIVNPVWGNPVARLGLVSGKAVLAALSEWSQTNFGVSFGANAIAQEMTLAEIDPEVGAVLSAIERTTAVPRIARARGKMIAWQPIPDLLLNSVQLERSFILTLLL